MAMLGPVLSQLANVTGELEANAGVDAQARKSQQDTVKHHGHAQKDVTHHYKITRTQTIEVDESEIDKTDRDEEANETKTQRKRCGCFSMCFGRKK